jgi:UDP-N-acetylmuramoyl-tripeptide--D-alanyl-D-alanine ligase
MESALVYLNDVAEGRRSVAVVGEMLELGRYSKSMHRDLGKKIARLGIDRMVAIGPSAGMVLDGAVSEGMPARKTGMAASADEALPLVREMTRTGDTILLKGSRGMQLESIFRRFRSK